MKFILALSVAAFLIMIGVADSQTPTATPNPAAPAMRTPVIVELFTSEGCSSCPPADALLAKLDSAQPLPNTEVIALEEHVDYWNQGGWLDPYSSSEWTARQEEYAFDLKAGQTFTPQMIVNGNSQFIGNRTAEAVEAIRKAAALPKTPVSIRMGTTTPKSANGVAITVGKLTTDTASGPPADVWLAITESELHTAVKAGENSGSDLHHAPVVRSLRKIGSADRTKGAAFSSTQNISLNAKWKAENLRVVVFIQERKSRRILGAATCKLLGQSPA
jgi:hypothetical protein